jgi:hypothetical protein
MNKKIALITLLLVSTSVFADNRYNTIADKLNNQIWGSDYKLKVNQSIYLASSSKLGFDIGFSEYRYCEIEYNPQRLDNMSNDAVAWIFGHELAHCMNNDKGTFVLDDESQMREYRADRIGLELMTKVGYSFERVLTDKHFLRYLDVPTTGGSHPSWNNRVKELGFN